MNKIFLIILIAFIAGLCSGYGQTESIKKDIIKINVSSIKIYGINDIGLEKYIPKQYEIAYQAECDINSDSILDAIVICFDTIENNLQVDNLLSNQIPKRPVMVFIGNEDGTFKYMGRNDNIALRLDSEYCKYCGIEGISVKDNYFTIENYEGDGIVSNTRLYYTFKVIDNVVYFHRFDETVSGDENYSITKRAKELGYPTFENYKGNL